jgi:heat shock protein HslJ
MKKHIGLILTVVLALALASCGGSGGSSSSAITGINWQWTAMQETAPASQSVVPPAEVSKYTIVFNTDGTVAIVADCRNVGGTYTTSGSDMKITLGPSTMIVCGEGSMDVIYLSSLEKVSSYAVENGQLQLKFASDGGKMDFQNGGAAQ